MNITREQFIVSLKEAFDEGWLGYLELKDEVCERIACEIAPKATKKKPYRERPDSGNYTTYDRV